MHSPVIKPMHEVLDEASEALLHGATDVNLLLGPARCVVPIRRPRPDNPTAEAADFLASVKACDLSGGAPCEACQ